MVLSGPVLPGETHASDARIIDLPGQTRKAEMLEGRVVTFEELKSGLSDQDLIESQLFDYWFNCCPVVFQGSAQHHRPTSEF